MTINYGLATQNSPDIKKSEYKPFVSLPKFGFKGKQNNLSPLSKDAFQTSLSFKGLTNKELNNLAKSSENFKSITKVNYSQLKYLTLDGLKDFDDKLIEQMYGVKRAVVVDFINKRLSQLEPMEKLNNAKDIKDYNIGNAFVINRKTNSPVKVEFTKKGNMVRAYIDNLKVGSMNLLEGHKSKDEVYVSSMISSENHIYKGVGSKMHQLALEISRDKGYGGKVNLEASDPGSKLFHYKSGFRVEGDNSESFSQQMEDVIAGKVPLSEVSSEFVKMSLPEEEIQRIVQDKVKTNPILKTNNVSFKGHSAKELNEILKTSKKLEIVRNSDYKDLRWFSNSFNSQSEERVLNLFGIPIEELNTIIDSRLQEFLPAEKIKNAKLVKNLKIGESQVIKRGLNTPVSTVFTQQGKDYDAFIGDINIGEVTLAPTSNSIFESNMLSADRKNYKGLGTKLHQLAVEKSFEMGYGGKVTLDAVDPGAKLFHYKSGFRKEGAGSEEFSQQMEDVISGGKELSSIDRSVVSMYLPQNQIQRIVDTQIKKSPIILDKNFKFILSSDPEKIKESQQIANPKILSGKDLKEMIKTSEKLQIIRTCSAEYLKDLLSSLYTENESIIINKFGININDLHYLINCRLNEIALKNK